MSSASMLLIMWANNLEMKVKPTFNPPMPPTVTMVIPPPVVYHVFTSGQAPLCKINSAQCLLYWHSHFYSALELEHPTLWADLDLGETWVHRLSHCGTTHVPPVPSIEHCRREQYSSINGGNFGGYPARCMRYASVGSLPPF